MTPSNGLVIAYNYLWSREFAEGEESGRKARPACVQIIIERGENETVVALFPITTQSPQTQRAALEVPQTELHRVGLRTPSWIIVDEWNFDDLGTSPHIADMRPLGSFSPAFMKRVRAKVAECIRARRHRAVPRK